MPMRMAVKRRPRARPASGTGPWQQGHPAWTRLASRVRALGAAEAEARFAGEAVDEDDDEGDARAALRRLGVRNADPRFAAALAHERAGFAKQARSS